MSAHTADSAYTRIEQLLPYEQELVAIRRHLHQHPELAFAEHGTSDFVAGKLQECAACHRFNQAGSCNPSANCSSRPGTAGCPGQDSAPS